tara:strand:+ start:354 stop:536 length:183 start_codon:yes stop_codon:yes gene_type:complete
MRRKNEVLDRISSLEDELGRLKDRIPVDTDPQYDLWLRIVDNCLKQSEYLRNIVELEEDD